MSSECCALLLRTRRRVALQSLRSATALCCCRNRRRRRRPSTRSRPPCWARPTSYEPSVGSMRSKTGCAASSARRFGALSVSFAPPAGPLVTTVYFPRLLLPLAGVVVPLIDLCLAGFVLVAMMAWYSTWPGAAVLVAPFFILLALVAALGAALALSALNTRYRDVPYAIPAFMQVLPFLSAVPFALDGVPLRWQWVLSINPMTAVVSGWRWAVLGGPQPILGQLGLSVGVAILVFIGGLAYFRRSEPRFADTI